MTDEGPEAQDREVTELGSPPLLERSPQFSAARVCDFLSMPLSFVNRS